MLGRKVKFGFCLLVTTITLLALQGCAGGETPETAQTPVVMEVLVEKEVTVEVVKEVVVTATPIPAPPTPISTPTPVSISEPAIGGPMRTLLEPEQSTPITEAEWEEICYEMYEYARDCEDCPEAKSSSDSRSFVLYSKEFEVYIKDGREIYLPNAHDWLRVWASEYAAKNGKDDTWVREIVRKLLLESVGMDIATAWESMQK